MYMIESVTAESNNEPRKKSGFLLEAGCLGRREWHRMAWEASDDVQGRDGE